MNTATSDTARYEAVRTRDPGAEGRFFYSVMTTGVYCRPTCPARLALRENVAFHESPEEAERLGFRACKRCRPRDVPQLERHARIVQAARALLESSDEPIGLADLAARVGLSPFYLHRLFKQHVGMTPHEYASANRLRKVGAELRDGAPVTAAIYEAGYSSSSRFYESGSHALGMPPSDVRRGGEGVSMRAVIRACVLGRVLVAATARGVCAIAFGDDDAPLLDDLHERFPRAIVQPSDDALDALAAEVVMMIDAAGIAANLPLDLMGTAFQQRVWKALREIPSGATSTYSEIARRIGAPRAVRAVGTACGRNPVAVVVPCHRVVREDGALGGYRWGLERKKVLLERERAK
jgi:AraC family transcriptional regulator of adaptative response/methylated-DNA-[protein]-cysteine methyltransferase